MAQRAFGLRRLPSPLLAAIQNYSDLAQGHDADLHQRLRGATAEITPFQVTLASPQPHGRGPKGLPEVAPARKGTTFAAGGFRMRSIKSARACSACAFSTS